MGLGPKKETISQTKFSDVDLERALNQSDEWYAKAHKTWLAPNFSYRMGEANYYLLVALAKKINLPENHPLVSKSNEWYAKTQKAFLTPPASCRIGKANYYLAKAITQYLEKDNKS